MALVRYSNILNPVIRALFELFHFIQQEVVEQVQVQEQDLPAQEELQLRE